MTTVCGKIFEDEQGRTCACEIEIPEPSAKEASLNMGMVFPFPKRHDGPHRGSPMEWSPNDY